MTLSVNGKLAKFAEWEGKIIKKQTPRSPPKSPKQTSAQASNPQYVNVSCLGINKKAYG